MKILSFLTHYITSDTRYSVHSPFVYEFLTRVLPSKKSPEGAAIERLRRQLSASNETIPIEDFGAGYGGINQKQIKKTMSQVVKSSARRRREGELLNRVISFYQPNSCLELGTNLGFSAMYLLAGMPRGSKFVTVEGSQSLTEIAKKNLSSFDKNIKVITGEFSKILSTEYQPQLMKPDFVFLDGHHKYQPTLSYADLLMPHMPPGSIFIFDDIHWSREMNHAWKEIIQREEVTVSIDLWRMGICFLKRNQAKENFKFRF